jgi:putative phosphonate catabolism associated alcohol dehydrogenase
MQKSKSSCLPSSARAVVFTAAGAPLELRELPLRAPRGGEILVRITCCTICGSDLHTYTGRRREASPTILGHEITGRVARFGPQAGRQDLLGRPLSEGDRITWTIVASCGACFYCTHELPQKCERLFKYGHQQLDDDHPLSGGLAEYCLLAPGTGIVRLPADLSDELAAPANCAVATVAAALRASGDCRDRVVLIQGAGMLGLIACAMARAGGAREVVCCDVQPGRLDRALQFGATRAAIADADADVEIIREAVLAASEGRGADVALELSGSSSAIVAGLPLLRIGGRYVLVGTVTPTPPVELDPQMLVRRWLTITGVHNYAPRDLVVAVEFLAREQHAFPIAQLVGNSFPLEQASQALACALVQAGPRVAVVPG